MTLGESTEYYQGALKVLLLSMFIFHLSPTQRALRKVFMNKVWNCVKDVFWFNDFSLRIRSDIVISENLSIAKQFWPNLTPKVFEATQLIAWCCMQDLYMSKWTSSFARSKEMDPILRELPPIIMFLNWMKIELLIIDGW